MSGFHVGQRVRMTAEGRETFPRDKSYTGVVVSFFTSRGEPYVGVRRDGYARRRQRFHGSFWEAIPADDLCADSAAVSLAHAVLAGETDAAKALADRVMEFCGATR